VRRHAQGLVDGHQMVEMTGLTRAELLDYGLLLSDLMRRQRGFLIVEGQHDLSVFQELIGAELAALRVEILPSCGARHLKCVLDSRVPLTSLMRISL